MIDYFTLGQVIRSTLDDSKLERYEFLDCVHRELGYGRRCVYSLADLKEIANCFAYRPEGHPGIGGTWITDRERGAIWDSVGDEEGGRKSLIVFFLRTRVGLDHQQLKLVLDMIGDDLP